jgi:short-subunit dehydrogenase
MNVVITGASRGLGKAMAEKFAAEGYNLYLTGRNEVILYGALENLMTRYPDLTIKAKAFDISFKDHAIAFAKWILGFGVDVDVLINNAGIFLPGSIFSEEDGLLEKMIETNLYSAYHITRELLTGMMAKKSGHIFNICSIASLTAYKNGGSYSISKFALAGFSKNLREEMKPYGIKVTAVYPGAVYTDSWAGAGVDAGRLMEAGDIASVIFDSSRLSQRACVEDIILRPQLGDL